MKANEIYFEGIILQPISNKKSPWSNYNKNKDEFLKFFQNAFFDNIQNYFNVNHKTEEFSEYLLIPYYTEGNKQCFGAYYIQNGDRSSSNDYTWRYNIDYSKSFNFIKTVSKKDIINEAEFCGTYFIPSGSIDYYMTNNLPKDFKKYIFQLLEEKPIQTHES